MQEELVRQRVGSRAGGRGTSVPFAAIWRCEISSGTQKPTTATRTRSCPGAAGSATISTRLAPSAPSARPHARAPT